MLQKIAGFHCTVPSAMKNTRKQSVQQKGICCPSVHSFFSAREGTQGFKVLGKCFTIELHSPVLGTVVKNIDISFAT